MPVPSVTTSGPLPRPFANTLPRCAPSSRCPRIPTLRPLQSTHPTPLLLILTWCLFLSSQGNCKFGPKCANIHVLPDGRRINYGKNGVTIGPSPISLPGRPASNGPGSPTSATGSANAFNPSTTSALTNSLYRADRPGYGSGFPGDERQQQTHHLGRQPSLDNGLPTFDTSYSVSNSNYGSPRDDDSNRFGLALSPAAKGLSILDAPLPASFDSNGISNAARFPAAPWPSSVPSKFGLDSPTASLSNAKDSRTSETLKLLHTSAFGSSDHLGVPTAGSPPSSQLTNGDEYFGKRAMHSSRYAKPKVMSSSLPKTTSVDRDWEAEFAFGDDSGENAPENYVPENLQDLLTPAEKARRGSMRLDGDLSIDGVTKYGSPAGSSPSRWGPLFQRQKEEEDAARSARNATSAFGHVGSPLRNSTLAQEMGHGSGGSNGSPHPAATRSGSESMSALSQQLQRSRIDDGHVSSPHLHPTRIPNTGISPIGKERAMERHVSSGSVGSSVTGRFTTPIDEEDPAFVFSMEEEEDPVATRMRKRGSAGLAMGGFGSYAGAVAGKGPANGAKDSREGLPVNGR